MKPQRPFAALAIAALLAACGGDAPQEGEVSGEVLEGTISDDMLNLEQVRTLPPLADPTGSAAGQAGTAADEASEAGDEEPAGEAEPPSDAAGDDAE